ncbi:MAG: extracellular solute-binding protein [Chloroflexi bacterium]|nr:extracellular solute-binding protein [Chloroflexota bacterium]
MQDQQHDVSLSCWTRRKLLAGAGSVGIAATGVLAAACGGTPAEAPKKVRSTPYTVRFMALGTNPWMLQQMEVFNREVGPQLKVQVSPEPQPGQAELWTKFQSTLAAGDVPDVARLKEIWVFEAYLKGAMQSLDGYFKTDKDFNAADLLPLYQDNFKYKGNSYAVAREVSIIVGYYNKANFVEFGLDPEKPPTTYEQFREFARRTTKAAATPEASKWGFQVYEYGTREFVLLWPLLHMRRFGAEFWNKDKTAIVLNTPTHVEVMSLFIDMINKDRSTVPPGVQVDGGRTGGKIAMWEQGTWDIPILPSRFPDLRFGVFPWPKKVNQGHVALAGSSAMTKASKDHDATWEFIKWWNAPDNQVGWYHNAGGNAPSRKSVYSKTPFSDNAIWKPIIPLITVGTTAPRPMFDRYTEIAEQMTPALMKGFRGEVTAKEALDEATRIGTTAWQNIGGSAAKAL